MHCVFSHSVLALLLRMGNFNLVALCIFLCMYPLHMDLFMPDTLVLAPKYLFCFILFYLILFYFMYKGVLSA